MNRNTFLSLLFALAFGATFSASAAGLKEGSRALQASLEGATLKFYLSADLTGVAVARECARCDPLRLRVTPKMKILDVATRQPLEWDATLNLGDRKADILYLPENKEITEVFLQVSR